MKKGSEAHGDRSSGHGPGRAAAKRQRTRRKVLRAGVMGIPVVITVCSRPARAQEALGSAAYGASASPDPPPGP